MSWNETFRWTIEFFFGNFKHFLGLVIWTIALLSVWHIHLHDRKQKETEK